MTSLGWHVEEDQFRDLTPYGEIPFSNVIATLDPAVTKRIVLACHYDSKLLPGFVAASDSAAPCSVMIETARWLGSMVSEAYSQGTIDFTLQLLFFDGEEAFIRWSDDDSLYGSRHLAELWERTPDRNYPSVNSLKNIKFFILLDLIGTTDTRFVNYYSNTSSLYYRMVTIEQCLKRMSLLPAATYQSVMFSTRGASQNVEDDHTPFIHKGVPVLHLISTPFPTAWHSVRDTIGNLNFQVIDKFSRVLRVFLASLLTGS
nr:glutaminyl-peptide cyclotransferase-like protein [Biomphalaria glabrata]